MTSPEQQAGVREGDVLAGRYRVERVLGVGGMGVVVAAHHIQLDEKVALKFLLPRATHSQESLTRFLREARAAAKIKNEHVARVIDVGQLENGSPYMVMEYLEGRDLAAWLQAHGAMPVEQAVDFVLQACEALADAHSLGIVHRDLKPANLFCIRRSDGQSSIKVLDFGISKITTPGAPGHDMTKTSALMGSPLYMSPEQMQLSKGVDQRTDIWALGVILFELVTGRPPFTAEAVTELAIKVANEPAPPVRAFRLDAPEGLERVIATCLEKDRAKRFQNVGELAIALKDFAPRHARLSVERVLGTLRNAGVSAGELPASGEYRAAPSSSAAPGPSVPQTAASWGQTADGTKPPRKTALGVSIAAVGCVAVVAGVLIFRNAAAPQPTATTAAAALPPPAAITTVPSTAAAPDAAMPPTIAVSALPVTPQAPTPAPVTRPALGRPGGGVAPVAAPPVAPPPPSRANCNPPYVIDASGNRQYKPECL